MHSPPLPAGARHVGAQQRQRPPPGAPTGTASPHAPSCPPAPQTAPASAWWCGPPGTTHTPKINQLHAWPQLTDAPFACSTLSVTHKLVRAALHGWVCPALAAGQGGTGRGGVRGVLELPDRPTCGPVHAWLASPLPGRCGAKYRPTRRCWLVGGKTVLVGHMQRRNRAVAALDAQDAGRASRGEGRGPKGMAERCRCVTRRDSAASQRRSLGQTHQVGSGGAPLLQQWLRLQCHVTWHHQLLK